MRIDAYTQVTQVYQTQKTAKVNKTNATYGSDKVEISQFGKDFQIAKQAVAAAPDVREDKVAEMKDKVASGSYEVSAEDLASKLAEKYGTTVF